MGLGVPGGSVCCPMQVRAVQGCSQPATELGGARLKAQACAGALQGLLHTHPQGEQLSWPWVVTQPLHTLLSRGSSGAVPQALP